MTRLRQVLAVGLAALLVAGVLAGCGGSQSAPHHSEAEACEGLNGHEREVCGSVYSLDHRRKEAERTTAAETAATPPPEEVGGPLSYVGTITGSGEGTTFTNRYSVGPLLYSREGTPPEEVLNDCLVRGSAAIASSVFARGQVKVTYQKGSLPVAIGAWPGPAVKTSEGDDAALVARRIDGAWHCTVEELSEIALEFQPGESQTIPFWIVDMGALTNARTQLPESVRESWNFSFFGPPVSEQEVQGPGQGWCENEYLAEWQLLLYNRSGEC